MKDYEELTQEEAEILNDFMIEMTTNTTICQICHLNHSGQCFFAIDCLPQNFKHFKENA